MEAQVVFSLILLVRGKIFRKTGWILQSTPGCTPGVDNRDLAVTTMEPFWRIIVGRDRIHLIK